MRDHSPLSGRQLPQPGKEETPGEKGSGATAGTPEAQESGSPGSGIPLRALPYSHQFPTLDKQS